MIYVREGLRFGKAGEIGEEPLAALDQEGCSPALQEYQRRKQPAEAPPPRGRIEGRQERRQADWPSGCRQVGAGPPPGNEQWTLRMRVREVWPTRHGVKGQWYSALAPRDAWGDWPRLRGESSASRRAEAGSRVQTDGLVSRTRPRRSVPCPVCKARHESTMCPLQSRGACRSATLRPRVSHGHWTGARFAATSVKAAFGLHRNRRIARHGAQHRPRTP